MFDLSVAPIDTECLFKMNMFGLRKDDDALEMKKEKC